MFSDPQTSPSDRHSVAEMPAASRSRVTNGSALLPDTDGRSAWSRRLRDLIAIHLSDLGGEDTLSEATKAIVRRAAVLTVQLERIESGWAQKAAKDEEPTAAELDLYQRASNSLRRLLESVGLDRRQRDVTPPVDEYLRRKAAEKAAAQAANGREARSEATDAEIVEETAQRPASGASAQ